MAVTITVTTPLVPTSAPVISAIGSTLTVTLALVSTTARELAGTLLYVELPLSPALLSSSLPPKEVHNQNALLVEFRLVTNL